MQKTTWQQVAWSADVVRGGVCALMLHRQPVVLFRGRSGRPYVLDAYCPHLGAHLGIGGTVQGESIRCPFHGWEIGGDGVCSHIPYSERIPPKATIQGWSVIERAGTIWARRGGEPSAVQPGFVREIVDHRLLAPLRRSYRFQRAWMGEDPPPHDGKSIRLEFDTPDAASILPIVRRAMLDAAERTGLAYKERAFESAAVGLELRLGRSTQLLAVAIWTYNDDHRSTVQLGIFHRPRFRSLLAAARTVPFVARVDRALKSHAPGQRT